MLYMGEGPGGNSAACSALCLFSVTSPNTHKQIGPFWCWFLGGWVCVRSRPLWVSPVNSPVRLGISPTAAPTPTSVFSQRFEALFPWAGTLGCEVCLALQLFLPVYLHLNVGPPSTPADFWPTPVSSRHLATGPLHPGCLSPPLLPVWMTVSSLTPWLSDFHTVQFSVSSGYFLFLNLLPFFWLCEEAKCVYLCLHPGQNSISLIASQRLLDSSWTIEFCTLAVNPSPSPPLKGTVFMGFLVCVPWLTFQIWILRLAFLEVSRISFSATLVLFFFNYIFHFIKCVDLLRSGLWSQSES